MANGNRIKHGPGARFGSLTITERLGTIRGSTRVRVRCDCGNVVERSLPNLISGATSDCADRAAHPHPLRKETPRYHTAHKRLRKIKGSASERACVRCGRHAEQWAYSNGDLEVLRDKEGKDAGLAYSTNPNHYLPMCRPCHSRFDRTHRSIVGDSRAVSLAHVAAWHLSRGESGLLVAA